MGIHFVILKRLLGWVRFDTEAALVRPVLLYVDVGDEGIVGGKGKEALATLMAGELMA